jgi:hypothetical protein
MKIELNELQVNELLLAADYVSWENNDFRGAVEALRKAKTKFLLGRAIDRLETIQQGLNIINVDTIIDDVQQILQAVLEVSDE